MNGKERERRLRDALKHMITAYGRPDKHEGAVRFAQRVLKETEGPPDDLRPIRNWKVPTLDDGSGPFPPAPTLPTSETSDE